MKLQDIVEMAVRNEIGFDFTREQWQIEVSTQSIAKDIKQINSNTWVKSMYNGNQTKYSLWVNEKMVSYVNTSKISIASKSYTNILFSASDPEEAGKGYATTLMWELTLILSNDIFIGGAISSKGEKSILSFVKYYEKMRGEKPKLINKMTGEIEKFDHEKLMTKPKLGLVYEDCYYIEAYVDTPGGRAWLNDNVNFPDCI